jgi:predicted lipid-binding transport protein (Tim44 family)
MRKWILLAAVFLVGGAFIATEVEARRLGGGRTVGTQRNVTAPPAQTPAKPTQQAAPNQQQPGQAAPAAGSRWGGILGGLALGGLLGYFLGGGGLMGSLLGILLLAGVVMLAVMAFRAFAMRRQEAPQQMQYAGMRETVGMPMGSSAPVTATSSVPAGFDSAGFLRAAKLSFLKLQMANDAGALDEIREFTTGELYEELSKDLAGRVGTQQTEVPSLDAELLEVASESGTYWASVRFSGMVREERGAEPVAFQELWNLVKPADGSSGWLLAGIQQMH